MYRSTLRFLSSPVSPGMERSLRSFSLPNKVRIEGAARNRGIRSIVTLLRSSHLTHSCLPPVAFARKEDRSVSKETTVGRLSSLPLLTPHRRFGSRNGTVVRVKRTPDAAINKEKKRSDNKLEITL